jgi:hypothetical protein
MTAYPERRGSFDFALRAPLRMTAVKALLGMTGVKVLLRMTA